MPSLVAYTIPNPSEVSAKVVGFASYGVDLKVPPDFTNHAHAGYDTDKVREILLPFDMDVSARVMSVFGKIILPQIKHSLFEPGGRYDPAFNCFNFALMVSGFSDKDYISPSEAEFVATEEVVRQGNKVEPYNTKSGQLIVVGGMREANARAHHALVVIDGDIGLQVMGPEGPVVIANHRHVRGFYETIYQARSANPPVDYGFFTPA